MGSSKKELESIDNSTELDFQQGQAFLLESVQQKLPSFKFLKSYHDPRGYWGVFFVNNNVTLFLGSERTFIDYFLQIGNEKITLSEIDERVLKLKNTSRANFLFLIEIINTHLINIAKF